VAILGTVVLASLLPARAGAATAIVIGFLDL